MLKFIKSIRHRDVAWLGENRGGGHYIPSAFHSTPTCTYISVALKPAIDLEREKKREGEKKRKRKGEKERDSLQKHLSKCVMPQTKQAMANTGSGDFVKA